MNFLLAVVSVVTGFACCFFWSFLALNPHLRWDFMPGSASCWLLAVGGGGVCCALAFAFLGRAREEG